MSIIRELISNGQSKIHTAIVGAGKDATQFSAYSPITHQPSCLGFHAAVAMECMLHA